MARISGLISGLDTDSLVQELVSAYSVKKDKYVKAQVKLDWKQEAWKELNTKINKLYKNAGNLRLSSTYLKKTASITDATKASVTAGASAVTGSQSLKIKQLARTAYMTGGEVNNVNDSTKKIKGSTKLSEMGVSGSSTISVNVDGKKKDVAIDENMTVDKFVTSLKDAGVNASFDEANQRFFINSKESGTGGDFSLSANTSGAVDALQKMGLFTVSNADISEYKKWSSLTSEELQSIIDTDYEKSKTKYVDAESEAELLKARVANDEKLIASNEAARDLVQYQIDYSNMTSEEQETLRNDLKDQIDALNAKVKDKSVTDEEKKTLADLQAKNSAIVEADTVLGNGVLTEEDKDTYKAKLVENHAAYQANVDLLTEDRDKYSGILADETGAMLADHVDERNAEIDTANVALRTNIESYYTDKIQTANEILAFNDIIQNHNPNETDPDKIAAYNDAVAKLGNGVKLDGQDSIITLNGVEFTSSTNNYAINGLTITAKEVTGDKDVTITTETDVDGIYNMIKDFIKEYNSLINEMSALYNASSSKGYEPLTDDEKSAMTDKDIEKWEQKIKDSLLRRDSTLDSVSYLMKNAMSKSYTVGDTKMNLGSFGIKGMNYFLSSNNEKGAYHIDGDPDDSETSGNTDKLRAAIASDPDSVVDFFTQLSKGLYDDLDKKMKSTEYKTIYHVYNDKKMKKEYDEYSKTIKKWEEKIAKMEDSYVKKFAAMETALSKLQSSTSSLTSMLG